MSLSKKFLALSEAVFDRYGWIVTPEIEKQRRTIADVFENYGGWKVLPIECGGSKSVSTQLFSLLDTDSRYIVAVHTRDEADAFVESWNQHRVTALAMGLIGEDCGNAAASHAGQDDEDRAQATEARVLVVCHASLMLAMVNPGWARQLGVTGDESRKLIVDEALTLISTRKHVDSQIEKLLTSMRWFQSTPRYRELTEMWDDRSVGLDPERVEADLEDLESVVDSIKKTSRDQRVSHELIIRSQSFPRVLDDMITEYVTTNAPDSESLVQETLEHWFSVMRLAQMVYSGWGAVLSAHDDRTIKTSNHLVETRSIVPSEWRSGVILDATARVRSHVLGRENFLQDILPCHKAGMVETAPVRDYKNVTVDLVSTSVTSADAICNPKNGFDSEWGWLTLNMESAIRQAQKDDEKVLFVMSKQMSDMLQRQRQLGMDRKSLEIPGGHKICYWNNGHRGSNEYRDCSRAFIFSLLWKPTWLYKLACLATDLGLQVDDPEFQDRWQAERMADIVEDLIQAANRAAHRVPQVSECGTRMMTKKSRITIYVPQWLKPIMTDVLNLEMPGVRINDVGMDQSLQIPGVSAKQLRRKTEDRGGLWAKWDELAGYVLDSLSKEDSVLVTDSKLQELAPHMTKGFKAKKSRLTKNESLLAYLKNQGSPVAVRTVRGQGLEFRRVA